MTIAFEAVFPVLAEAIPGFKAYPEDLYEGLAYPFLSHMVRFVCDRGYAGLPEYEPLLSQFAALLESLISDGDRDVHDLAHDALESVWAREEREFVASFFGPKTRALWVRICAGERG
jgi:hypothetical protein